MADSIYELLVPHFDAASSQSPSLGKDPLTTTYLNRLSTLSLPALTSTEPQSLHQSSHSLLLSLQALSKRSHKSIIESTNHLSNIPSILPTLAQSTADLRDALPQLDDAAITFAETYNNRAENSNPLLERRKEAILLSRNIDRLADILELPTLLSSTISSSATSSSSPGPGSSSTASSTLNYASALDLNSHIRRLHTLYPESPLVTAVSMQADDAMQEMCTNLITLLKNKDLKLAAAMRAISWLRRVAPELDAGGSAGADAVGNSVAREGSLGSLFLVCRLTNFEQMLDALEPLRALADQETSKSLPDERKKERDGKDTSGLQTERYLKRYIEVFREQSFAIISMYRSIFPPEQPVTSLKTANPDPFIPLPSALSTFPLKLVDMLQSTLHEYLPNIRDRSTRDSLLTQVLYCAGSLGRLGGDFGLMLASIVEDEVSDDEDAEADNVTWVEVMKKHRLLAGRLEGLVSKD